jgi:hypothetical protein
LFLLVLRQQKRPGKGAFNCRATASQPSRARERQRATYDNKIAQHHGCSHEDCGENSRRIAKVKFMFDR